jgi:hypothetical protein
MNVTLKIKDDAELRNYIKECIKGQVLSIVREDFIEVVKAEITRKIGTIGNRDFDYLQKQAFEAAAKQIVLKNNGISDWSNDFIKPLLTEVLNKRINEAVKNTNWKNLVDTLAKEKVKALIS